MPFTNEKPQFEIDYDRYILPDDLIYGLSPERSGYINTVFADSFIKNMGIHTVDEYSWKMIKQWKLEFPKVFEERKQKFREFLIAISKHPKYKHVYDRLKNIKNWDEAKLLNSASAADMNAFWRAKSKFGLEYTLRKEKGRIHFVLDKIDMGAVVSKNHEFKDAEGQILAKDVPWGKPPATYPKAETERTITHAELRWIYRNRKNRLLQQRVQFWLNKKPCNAPWTFNDTDVQTATIDNVALSWHHAWIKYAPKNEPQNFHDTDQTAAAGESASSSPAASSSSPASPSSKGV